MIVAAFVLSSSMAISGIDHAPTRYKIAIETDGVYQLAFEDLGSERPPLRSNLISISVQGKEIPVWIRDGGDGWLNDGDTVIFIGQHPRGATSYFSENSRFNIYWLTVKEEGGLRMREARLASVSPGPGAAAATVTRRLEEQKLRVALPHATSSESSESWYMSRISHLDSRAFSWRVDLGPMRTGTQAASVRVGLAGLSLDQGASAAALAQHRIELSLNGTLVGSGEWDGQEAFVIEVPKVYPELLASGWNQIDIRVPRRKLPGGESPVIDVSLLNWIEFTHPFGGMPKSGQQAIEVASGGAAISAPGGPGSLLVSQSGRYIIVPQGDEIDGQLDEAGRWYALRESALLAPAWVRMDRPSTLLSTNQQADYLIITNAVLANAIAPLAEHHESNGLKVAVIDIEDIYDEFSDGLRSPESIRDFIGYARRHWQHPAPRFVLLAGDASWDIYEADGGGTGRDLVPTLQVQAHDELAASDNGFAALTGDDWHPDLAVGRIPASDPEELSAIVAKLLRYETDPEVGPWRRRVAWVTDRDESFQAVSSRLAHRVLMDGFRSDLIFPSAQGGQQHQDQGALKQALTDGAVLLHFLGHGGRYVWRTGPPDYRGSSDLFRDTDLEELPASSRLPLVLSMTCSSGPFDHPTADSIAEAFLRAPESGAIGVLAASWRVPASEQFSRALIAELTAGTGTVGEAVMKAKQAETNRALVESYNYLGDPAMRLSRPPQTLMPAARIATGAVTVSFAVGLGQFPDGMATIDWLDRSGRALKSEERSLNGGELEFRYPLGADHALPSSASVYVWSSVASRDAMGSVELGE